MMKPTRCTLLLFCLLSAFLVAGCSSPEENKEEYLKSALSYIDKNEKEAAIIELKNAIQIDAKFAEARYQLGLLYLEKGETQKAFSELSRVADLDPDNLDANLKTAQFLFFSRKKKESREKLEHILALDSSNRGALILLANLELMEGNFDTALTTLDRIKNEDAAEQVQQIQGRIYAAQEDWDNAEKSFSKAISINEKQMANYLILLRLYEQTQEREKAKALLDKMVEKFPESPEVYLFFAGFYMSTGDKKAAEEQLQKVVNIAPDKPYFRLQLAQFYRKNMLQAQREEILTKARADFPEDSDVAAALATYFFEGGQYDEAKIIFDEVVSKTPDNKGIKLLEARWFQKDGKVKESLVILQKITTDYPDWAAPYFYLALAHNMQNEFDLAQQAVSIANQKDRREAQYHSLLAQLYLKQASFKDAQKEATIALRLNPKDLRSAIILSHSLIGDKKFEHAVKILKELRKQVPGNVAILESLSLASLGVQDKTLGEEILNELLDIDPAHKRAIALYLGLNYRDDLDGAQQFIVQQIDKAPEDFGLQIILGGILAKQDKDKEAFQAFERAREINPQNPRPYLAAAELYKKAGNAENALAQLQSLLNLQPDSLPALKGIAGLKMEEGDVAAAITYYEKALQIKEDDVAAANNLAWILATEGGDLGRALQLAMMAKQAYPDQPQIADTLGWVHFKRNSYSLAIAQFELALQKDPDNPTIIYHLALALSKNDKKDQAIAKLKELLEQPDNFDVRPEAEKLFADLQKS